ncbi:hypothetical protein [Nocardia sp. SSK8]|uniref:hypothetical protein n=1 Tax=Nocardia sp. SSK8 TaxID=3120154 RepID=UPI003008AE57
MASNYDGDTPLTPYERELLEFAVTWAPYGGNDAEAFVRFGLPAKEFHARLLALLETAGARGLGHRTITRLHCQCVDRLRRS